MFLLKNFKENCLPTSSDKRSLSPTNDKLSPSPTTPRISNFKLDENQVKVLREWLDDLNRNKFIFLTDQNDIVIMAGGETDQAQQIFVNSKDIDHYMRTKERHLTTTDKLQIISMDDLARILLRFNYVYESSGQLSFNAHTIALGSNEYKWLKSIIHDAQIDRKSNQTKVSLFDGEHTQILSIPNEYMRVTNNIDIIANYLIENGLIRYDVQNKSYIYRYIEPDILLDENIKSPERINQQQYLSFHIRQIYIDKQNKSIQLEFRYQPNDYLILPNHWYYYISSHQFNRDYIIQILLSNGGIINKNKFIFRGKTYSLQENHFIKTNSTHSLPIQHFKTVHLSSREKDYLISEYIDLVIQNDGTIYDNIKELFVIENPTDNEKLYFSNEDSLFIKENQFKRQHVIHILNKYSQIKEDQYDHWLLYYNNQYLKFPSSIISSSINKRNSLDIQKTFSPNIKSIRDNNDRKSFDRYDNIIDYMYRHGLITWDKSSQLIRLHFSDQTLALPIDHLHSIIDPNILSSSSINDDILPFTSRQLSQWLINNSYITRKTQ